MEISRIIAASLLATVLLPGVSASAEVADGLSLSGWGRNDRGQLGDGSTSHKYEPFDLGTRGVVAAVSDDYVTLALRPDGTLIGWGSNEQGQLGPTAPEQLLTPTELTGFEPFVDIAVSGGFSYAFGAGLTESGEVWTWGVGYDGNGGEPFADDCSSFSICYVDPRPPARIGSLTDVVAIDLGGSYGLALRADGTVWAWGWNGSGQAGQPDGEDEVFTPKQVPDIRDAVQVSAGETTGYALLADGTVRSWGSDWCGELGAGSTYTPHGTIRQVSRLTDVAQIAGGGAHAHAMQMDGTVWGWGCNALGQLGDGTQTHRNTPVSVKLGSEPLTGIVDIAPGDRGAIALRYDGGVFTWGNNDEGWLGTSRYSGVVNAFYTGVNDGALVFGGHASRTAFVARFPSACPTDEVPDYRTDDQPRSATHGLTVDCVLWWELMDRRDANNFGAAVVMSRGEMADALARFIDAADGAGLPTEGSQRFSDTSGHEYETSINRVAEVGIVQGRTNGTYGPDEIVTRGSMATFLVRAYEHVAEKSLARPTFDYFNDDNGHAHETSINKAAHVGFTTGKTASLYAPSESVTRAQMASFIARMMDWAVLNGLATTPS